MRHNARSVLLSAMLFTGFFAIPGCRSKREDRSVPAPVKVPPVPKEPIGDTDSIEMRELPGYSSFMRYYVRVQGDGQVERVVPDCPLPADLGRILIPRERARELIQLGRATLWPMRSGYGPPEGVTVMDAGASQITVTTATLVKRVTASAGEPGDGYYKLFHQVAVLSGIDPLADRDKFSADRKKECDALERAPRRNSLERATLP